MVKKFPDTDSRISSKTRGSLRCLHRQRPQDVNIFKKNKAQFGTLILVGSSSETSYPVRVNIFFPTKFLQ